MPMNHSLPLFHSFSEREREIFSNLLEGYTNQEIAASLGIREKTVEEHLTSIYRKMGVKSRNQAILWWVSKIKISPH
jgi:DNA-binding NarL/FixJ family response regulator